jgi:hypothetical protein
MPVGENEVVGKGDKKKLRKRQFRQEIRRKCKSMRRKEWDKE